MAYIRSFSRRTPTAGGPRRQRSPWQRKALKRTTPSFRVSQRLRSPQPLAPPLLHPCATLREAFSAPAPCFHPALPSAPDAAVPEVRFECLLGTPADALQLLTPAGRQLAKSSRRALRPLQRPNFQSNAATPRKAGVLWRGEGCLCSRWKLWGRTPHGQRRVALTHQLPCHPSPLHFSSLLPLPSKLTAFPLSILPPPPSSPTTQALPRGQ